MGIPDHLICLLRNLYAGQEATVRTGHGTTDWFQIEKGSTSRLYIVTLLIQLLCRVHHEKHWARRSTSWNQDCREKYQYPQICRWHHPYGRKWRGKKRCLDEIERIESKIWLKAQYSENEDRGIRSHHFMGNRWGNNGNSIRLYFSGLQNHYR